MTTQPVTIADANLAEMRIEEEAAWGVADVTPTYTDLPYTNESLGQDTETMESEIIVSSRRVKEVIVTGIMASGDIVSEVICEQFDALWEALSMGTYSSTDTEAAVAVDITVSGEDTVFTRTDAGDWTTKFTVGDWVKTSTLTLAANNGFRKVKTVIAAVLTLAGATGTADPTETVTVDLLAAVVDGNTFRSYTGEREHTDLANTFEQLLGLVLNGCALAINNQQKLGVTFSFLGKSETNQTATGGDGSPTAVSTNNVLSVASDTALFMEGDGGSDRLVNLGLNFTNGIYPVRAAGEGAAGLAPIAMGKGTKGLTGTFEGLFELTASQLIMNKYRNQTESAVAVVLTDAAGNAIVFDVPRILYTNARSNVGGRSQSVMVNADWTASEATEGSVKLLWRIATFTA